MEECTSRGCGHLDLYWSYSSVWHFRGLKFVHYEKLDWTGFLAVVST